jgi:transposase
VDVVSGQASDAPLLERMSDATTARPPGIDELVGDKGFDGDRQRKACLDRDVVPQIPNKANPTEPWPFEPAAYRERSKSERLFGKLKQFRRVVTGYEKLRARFLGVIHLALGFIRLRKSANVNTA